jgi:glutathione S-transferase
MERLVVFLPLLWLAASNLHSELAAGLGAVFLISRHVYWQRYAQDPSKRSAGNAMTMVSIAALLVMVLVGLARNAIA